MRRYDTTIRCYDEAHFIVHEYNLAAGERTTGFCDNNNIIINISTRGSVMNIHTGVIFRDKELEEIKCRFIFSLTHFLTQEKTIGWKLCSATPDEKLLNKHTHTHIPEKAQT